MDIDWRTVQLFLDESTMGVFEVEIDAENHKKARCSCPSFSRQATCKHVRFVKSAMKDSDGHYSIQIPVEISDEEALLAMSNAEAFRDFIIKYGKVEVID